MKRNKNKFVRWLLLPFLFLQTIGIPMHAEEGEEIEDIHIESTDEEVSFADSIVLEEEPTTPQIHETVDDYDIVVEGNITPTTTLQVEHIEGNYVLGFDLHMVNPVEGETYTVSITGEDVPRVEGTMLIHYMAPEQEEILSYEINDTTVTFQTTSFSPFVFYKEEGKKMLKANAPMLKASSGAKLQVVTREFVKKNGKLIWNADCRPFTEIVASWNAGEVRDRVIGPNTITRTYNNVATYQNKPIGAKVTYTVLEPGVAGYLSTVSASEGGTIDWTGGGPYDAEVSYEFFYSDDPSTIIQLENSYMTFGSLGAHDPSSATANDRNEMIANATDPNGTIYVSDNTALVTMQKDGLTYVGAAPYQSFHDDPNDIDGFAPSVAGFLITAKKMTYRIYGMSMWWSPDTFTYGYDRTQSYTLTINYLEKGTDKVLASAHGPKEYEEGSLYKVESPTVKEYTLCDPSQALITGNMPSQDTIINVYYEKDPKLTIRYLNQLDKSEVAKQNGPTLYKAGTEYAIPSPTIDNFYLVDNKQATIEGNMPNKDTTIDVFYLPYCTITTEVVHGTITPSMEKIKIGENKTITYTPEPKHILESIEIDGKKLNNPLDFMAEYEFQKVEKDHHIKVVYIPLIEPVKEVKDEYGKNAQGVMVSKGDILTYTIRFQNPSSSSRVFTITDVVPENTSVVKIDQDGKEENGKLIWEMELAGKAEGSVSFQVKTLSSKVRIPNEADQSVPEATITSNEVYHFVPEPPVKDVKNDDGESIHQEYVERGSILHYEITVHNNADTTKIFTITDAIPKHTELVSIEEDGSNRSGILTWRFQLESDAYKTVHFTVKAIDDNTVIRNQAVEYVDDAVIESNEVVNWILPKPTKAVKNEKGININGKYVSPGTILHYEINIENTAEVKKEFVVQDTLAEGLEYVSASENGTHEKGIVAWKVQLEPNTSKTLTLQAKVIEANTAIRKNQAQVSVDHIAIETNPVHNYVPRQKDGSPLYKAVLDTQGKDIHGAMVQTGDVLHYVMTVENVTDQTKSFRIKDTLPLGTIFIKASDDAKFAENELTWHVTIPGNDTKQVSFDVRVQAKEGTVTNTAYVSVDEALDVPTNEVVNTVVPSTESHIRGSLVTVHKAAKPDSGSVVKTGDEIEYTLTAINTGTKVSGKTIMHDEIPVGTEYVEGSASKGGEIKDGVVTFVTEGLQPQEARTFRFKVKVVSKEPRLIKNQASYTTDDEGTKRSEETVHGMEEITIPARLQAIKSVNPIGTVHVGDTLTYTISIRNIGGVAANQVAITDVLPNDTELVTINQQGTWNETRNRIEWHLDTLNPKETVQLTFQVKVKETNSTIRNQAEFDMDIPKESLKEKDLNNSTNIVENAVVRNPEPVQPAPVNHTISQSKLPVPNTSDIHIQKYILHFGVAILVAFLATKQLTKR